MLLPVSPREFFHCSSSGQGKQQAQQHQ